MSSRIVPLAALSVMLVVIFWAVMATAQQFQGGVLPVQQQLLPAAVPQAGAIQPDAPLQAPQFQPLPQPPFQLNEQEQAFVDRVLQDWQTVSGRVKTLEATFTRFDYDGVFGDPNKATREVEGRLRYAAPDKGHYELNDGTEKWVCTGTAIFEFRNVDKTVREHRLPPELQGQAISDGPMPFVFGVDKEKMKARYWVRIITPPGTQGEVWLEAYPRTAKDAANFRKVDVILRFTVNSDGTIADLQPKALNQHLPNDKARTAYLFTNMTINGAGAGLREWFNWFVRPNTPFGWQHQVIDDNAPAGPQAPQPATPAAGIGAAPPTALPR